jgi:hypothetical protein
MLLSLWISMLSLRNLSESQIWRTLVAQRQQPGTSYARIRLESWNRRSNNRWLAYRNSIFPHDGKLLALIWVRKSPAPTWLALLGTAAVLAFVLIRAASLHHIDRFIGQPDLELGVGDARHFPGARCERVAALESQYAKQVRTFASYNSPWSILTKAGRLRLFFSVSRLSIQTSFRTWASS